MKCLPRTLHASKQPGGRRYKKGVLHEGVLHGNFTFCAPVQAAGLKSVSQKGMWCRQRALHACTSPWGKSWGKKECVAKRIAATATRFARLRKLGKKVFGKKGCMWQKRMLHGSELHLPAQAAAGDTVPTGSAFTALLP
eukprot:scaffold133579_cov18-Tisochrysis_lutea.AAC.1